MRILFVDDDPILREFALVNLASEHAQVDTASDGAQALTAIAARTPDIVLLDLEMPTMDGLGMDGLGLLQTLRADPAHRDLPVMVVTGREDVEAVERAFASGATSFVVKPLNWRLLSHQLRYVHRTALNERRLDQSRADAAGRLVKLAAEGARFAAAALARDPSLKADAVAFAKAADAALKHDDRVRAA